MVTDTAVEPTTLLARAMLLTQAAQGLSYPDARLMRELADGQWLAQLELAVAALDEADQLRPPVATLAQAIAALPAASASLAEEHTRLFARQVLVSPYASSYDHDPGQSRPNTLQEVMAFYRAFGLRIDPHKPDLPDHIGAQLEFLAVLLAKEAYAHSVDLHESATICREARSRFSREHMVGWLPRFVERLSAQARLDFYPALTALIMTLIALETDIATEPASDGLLDRPDEAESFTCGLLPGAPPVDEPEIF